VKTEDSQLLLHEAYTEGDEPVHGVAQRNIDIKAASQRHQRKRSHDGMTFKYSVNHDVSYLLNCLIELRFYITTQNRLPSQPVSWLVLNMKIMGNQLSQVYLESGCKAMYIGDVDLNCCSGKFWFQQS